MKRTVKTAGVRRQTTKTVRKKTAKTVKTPKKHVKKGGSDALRAIKLTGILIALSAVISLAVITYYKTGTAGAEFETVAAADKTEKKSEPVISVSVQEPEQQSGKTAAKNKTPAYNDKTRVNPAVETSTKPVPSQESKPVKSSSSNSKGSNPAVNANATNATAANTNTTAAQRPSTKTVEKNGNIIFIIDDAGNNLRELEPFLRISEPLTIAVLPGLPNSAEAAKRIRAAGKEVFLHQPMEAIGGQNPGPGAIYSGMSAGEIRAVLKRNIEEVGPIAGMNNHQGSKITMDAAAMETILSFCAENGLYFLDSRTTAETVVPSVARRLGIKIGERDTFLDNEQDKESMIRYIVSGLEKARKNGSAVMIGHTWSPELAPILAEQFPKLIGQGYTIKTASDIIKSK